MKKLLAILFVALPLSAQVYNNPSNFPVMPQRGSLTGQYLMNEGTGTVSRDSSGNGNDALISGGFTWEGTADLDNTASTAQIKFPSALNTFKTFQVAFYEPPFGSAAYPQPPGYGQPSAYGIPTILCGSLSTQPCFVAASDYNFRKAFRFFAAGGGDSTESADSMTAGWHVWTLVCGAGAVKTVYYVDGQEVGGYITQGSTTCGTATTASGNMSIGTSPGVYSGNTLLGKVGGAWFWSTALSRNDVASAAKAALDFIANKGVVMNFRPVTTSNPRILACCDSRTWGVNLTPSTVWPATMVLTDATYDRVNLAEPSETASDTLQQFDLLYAPQKGAGPIITVIWGFTNDEQITGPALTARQIADSLKGLVQKAKLLGRVVIATEISLTVGGNTATYDAMKNAVDPLIRAEAFGWGADNIADLATDVNLGANNASLNTTYFVDGAHQTLAGEAKITAVMQDAVNELLGSTETSHSLTSAASYSEVAGDRYLDLAGSVAETITLPTCIGKALPRHIYNAGTTAGTVNTVNGEGIFGSTTLAVGVHAILDPIPGAMATSGCTWRRVQ